MGPNPGPKNQGGQENAEKGFMKLMQLFAKSQPSKHAKGYQKPKQRKKYRDKSRARYVARMERKREEGVG